MCVCPRECVCVCVCVKAECQVLTRASKERQGGSEITSGGFPTPRLETRLQFQRVRQHTLPPLTLLPGAAGGAGVNAALAPALRAGIPGPRARSGGRRESRESPARSPSAPRFPPRAIYSSAASCCRELTSHAEHFGSESLPEIGDIHKFREWHKCF